MKNAAEPSGAVTEQAPVAPVVQSTEGDQLPPAEAEVEGSPANSDIESESPDKLEKRSESAEKEARLRKVSQADVQ